MCCSVLVVIVAILKQQLSNMHKILSVDSQENNWNCCHQMPDFKAKMHQKINFGWGSAPDPAGGAYSAPPDPLAAYKGAYF